MQFIARLLLIALVAGLAMPRHACCAMNAAFGELESVPACCCCQTPQPAESSPLNQPAEGPCCKALDQILLAHSTVSLLKAIPVAEFWIPVLALATRADCCAAVGLPGARPSSPLPRPVRVVFCQWNC